jgi:multiple antibiotic resistance protein
MSLYSLSLSLFILMDSIGNVPLFLALLKGIDPKRQRKIILREMVIALLIIIAFYFLGDLVLSSLKVSQETLMVTGGIILFLIALKMIFPPPKELHNHDKKAEPFIVPLAIPLIAGPAVIASVMLYARRDISASLVISAIAIAWGLSTLILLIAPLLHRLLDWRILSALERLMGLLLTLMAVQMFLEGIKQCFRL